MSYVKKNEFSREAKNSNERAREREREIENGERDENARWKLIPGSRSSLVGTSRTKKSPECSFVQRI